MNPEPKPDVYRRPPASATHQREVLGPLFVASTFGVPTSTLQAVETAATALRGAPPRLAVCLDDAIVFVRQPWTLGTYALRFAAAVVIFGTMFTLLVARAAGDTNGASLQPVFLTWLIGVLVAVTLYRRHVRARLFRELSGVPAAELAARGDALRFELATIRALRLKSEDLQLIIVREAQPDTVVRVPFK